ncbi:hypothetical protein ACVWXU_007966 [Streptomyces sp. TE33382]
MTGRRRRVRGGVSGIGGVGRVGSAGCVGGVLVRFRPVQRALRFVRAPGAVGQVPQQPHQRGGHEGRDRQAASRLGPPATLLGRQEAQPGPPAGAAGRARALPGHQIQGHFAGRGRQQDGQAEREEPHQYAVQPDGAGAAGGGGPHPVGEVDHHEREQEQPQGAGSVAGGEVGPAVRLRDGFRPVALRMALAVDVLGTPVHGCRRVTGDPDRPGIVEHLLRCGAADTVDQQFERCPGALRGLGGRGQWGDSLSGPFGLTAGGGGRKERSRMDRENRKGEDAGSRTRRSGATGVGAARGDTSRSAVTRIPDPGRIRQLSHRISPVTRPTFLRGRMNHVLWPDAEPQGHKKATRKDRTRR